MTDLFRSREEKRDKRYQESYVFLPTQTMFNTYIDRIMDLNYWVLDTETTGLDPHDNRVIMMQIGNKDKQYLIDTREVTDLGPLKERVEDPHFIKWLHNAKFDYKMIKGTFGIDMEGMRCSMLLERILKAGLSKHGYSMANCALKYLGVTISKEMQTSFIGHEGPFTRKQLTYAALDCVYPDHYIIKQLRKMDAEELRGTFVTECDAIPAFGDAEYYGMILDEKKWEDNIKSAQLLKDEAVEKFKIASSGLADADLFGTAEVNPASSTQVLNLFTKMFDPNDLIDEDSKDKKSALGTGKGVLSKLCDKYDNPDVVTSLIEYRKHDKSVSTYGYSYIKHIHLRTGRFHPNIMQIGTDTGRPSGKKPSMLNIPAKPAYRVPWIAGPGRKILTNDYGACELRIMASMSGDPVMCKGFNDGLDYHTYTASTFIEDNEPFLREFIPSHEPGKGKLGDFILDTSGNKIKNPGYGELVPYDRVLKEQRSVAKTINFGLAYGMGVMKLSRTLGITRELAKEYITQFNSTFKVLVAWLKEQQELALQRGYAETFLGRKRYFIVPKKPEHRAEWDKIRFNRDDPFDDNLPEPWKQYHKRRAGIKREGGNSPIQGGNADITKRAMTMLRHWIKEFEAKHNDGNYLAHIALQVYDELIVDCPAQYAEEFAANMDRIMKEAAKEVIINVPVETGCIIADSWVKG